MGSVTVYGSRLSGWEDNPGGFDHFTIFARAAVRDRGSLASIPRCIVNAAAGKGGEHVLDGVDLTFPLASEVERLVSATFSTLASTSGLPSDQSGGTDAGAGRAGKKVMFTRPPL